MNVPRGMLARIGKIREWNEVNVVLTGPGKGEPTLVVIEGDMYGFDNKAVKVKVNGALVGSFKRLWLDKPGEDAVWQLFDPAGNHTGQEGTARESITSLVTMWTKTAYPVATEKVSDKLIKTANTFAASMEAIAKAAPVASKKARPARPRKTA